MIQAGNLAAWRALTMRITSEGPCEGVGLDVC